MAATLATTLAGLHDPDAPVASSASASVPGSLPPALAARPVEGIGLDSRLLERGDLYLAVAGASTHGIRHAEEALARGAVAIAIDPSDVGRFDPIAARAHAALVEAGAPLVEVPALAARAGAIAARFHAHPDRALTLVAVTGTDGKTSTCRFVAAALEALGTPCGYVGTLGWGRGERLERTALTTPDGVSLQRMLAALRDRGARAVALEASSHALASGRLDGVAIDVAVLTNLGRDHLDYHGDLGAYRRAKGRLFEFPSLTAVVLNGADAFGRELAATTPPSLARVLYAVDPSRAGSSDGPGEIADADPGANPDARAERPDAFGGRAQIGATEIRATPRGLSFTLVDGACRRAVDSALMGRFNVANLLACHATLRALGHSPEAAADTLGELPSVAGRMERFAAEARPVVVVDYAHTPQALAAAIAAAREHCTAALWVVFGCGGDRDSGKRAPMGRAAEAADHVVVTDDNPRGEASADIIAAVLDGMRDRDRATVIPDRRRAIAYAVRTAAPADLVLIAGKGHEDYQIVGERRLALSDRHCVDELLAEAC